MQITDNKRHKVLAKDLKVIIANYIIEHYGRVILASEVMYGSSRKVVDMLFVYKDNLYGIEIKSEADNTARLSGQLKEYEKLFDYILVFSSENHVNNISRLISEKTGLFYIKKGHIFIVNKPRKNSNTEKVEMLNTIPSSVIKQNFKITGDLNSDEIRKHALKKSKKDIHRLLISYFVNVLPNRPKLPTI